MVLSLALQRTGGLCARRAHSLLRPSGAKRSAGGFTKIPDQNKAYLFNEGPGPRKMQAWEYIIYPTYIIAAAILFIGLPNVPNTGIKDWAREEAEMRNKLEAQGVKLEYGTFYAEEGSVKYTKEVGQTPEVEDEE